MRSQCTMHVMCLHTLLHHRNMSGGSNKPYIFKYVPNNCHRIKGGWNNLYKWSKPVHPFDSWSISGRWSSPTWTRDVWRWKAGTSWNAQLTMYLNGSQTCRRNALGAFYTGAVLLRSVLQGLAGVRRSVQVQGRRRSELQSAVYIHKLTRWARYLNLSTSVDFSRLDQYFSYTLLTQAGTHLNGEPVNRDRDRDRANASSNLDLFNLFM
jgi:hypothetical protein